MMILSPSQQAPSPMEAESIADSVLQSNRSSNEAVLDYTAQEVQKNEARFQENIAIAAAEITGKGTALDIRG